MKVDREKHRSAHKTYQKMKNTVATAGNFVVLIPKIFNFHSVILVSTANSKIKATCDYKIGTRSDGNLIPIKKFKLVFPDTTPANLNKSIDKKVFYTHTTAHVYHKWEYAK